MERGAARGDIRLMPRELDQIAVDQESAHPRSCRRRKIGRIRRRAQEFLGGQLAQMMPEDCPDLIPCPFMFELISGAGSLKDNIRLCWIKTVLDNDIDIDVTSINGFDF